MGSTFTAMQADPPAKKQRKPRTAPTRCDLCRAKLLSYFVDGKTRFGMWANLCVSCHDVYGLKLGTGRGQLYEIVDGHRVKVWG